MLDQGGVPRARSARSAGGYSTMAAALPRSPAVSLREAVQLDGRLLKARAALIERIDESAPGLPRIAFILLRCRLLLSERWLASRGER